MLAQLIENHKIASEEEIPICGLNTYVKGGDRLRRSEKVVPTLYSSAWKAEDGSLGIALANISDEARELEFSLDPSCYGLSSQGEVSVITSAGQPYLLQTYDGVTPVKVRIPERSTFVLSIR